MDTESARILAEALRGVGDGATLAFIVWAILDFLKAAMVPTAWIVFFLWAYKPVFKAIRAIFVIDGGENDER